MAEGKIYEAISNVMADIGAVGKNSKNLQQGFMFRGIDAVMNAINPALIKYKVFVVPEILEQSREERKTAKGGLLIYSICKVKYTFYAEDGSFVESVVIGEGMDSGDKATNKAMSIAFKYACFQVFCIPTEEMKDPDADSQEPTLRDSKPAGNKPSGNTKPSATKPTQQQSKPAQQSEQQQQTPADDPNAKIDAIKIATLNGALQKKGVSASSMLGFYKVKAVEELTISQFMDAMNKLTPMPDRQ